MDYIMAIGIATGTWFVSAAVLFFNPPVDKVYNTESDHPAVKFLPQNAQTIGKILLAIVIQCAMWALVYYWIESALPDDTIKAGLIFGGIISLVKIVPRDIDRLLLTTYPSKRMIIEFVVGIVCAFVVGFVYAWWL
jgi:putative flippase GtrA